MPMSYISFFFFLSEKANGFAIVVPEDPEPSTPTEKMMAQMGMMAVDVEITNVSTGLTLGLCFIIFIACCIMTLDAIGIKREWPQIKSNWRNMFEIVKETFAKTKTVASNEFSDRIVIESDI